MVRGIWHGGGRRGIGWIIGMGKIWGIQGCRERSETIFWRGGKDRGCTG